MAEKVPCTYWRLVAERYQRWRETQPLSWPAAPKSAKHFTVEQNLHEDLVLWGIGLVAHKVQGYEITGLRELGTRTESLIPP